MYYYITDIQGIVDFQKKLIAYPKESIGFDTETSGLDPYTATLLLIQCDVAGDQFIFDCRKLGDKYSKYVIELSQSREMIGFNLKFDIKMIKQKFDLMLENLWDIQLAEVISENGLAEDRYPTLEFVSAKYLKVELDKTVRTTFYDPSWDGIITDAQIQYAAEDVKYLKQLKEILEAKIIASKQKKILDLENKFIPVLAAKELFGIRVDVNKWMGIISDIEEEAKLLEKELKEDLVTAVFEKKQFENCYEAVRFLHTFTKTKLEQKSFRASLESLTDLSYVRQYVLDNINIDSPSQLLAIFRDALQLRDHRGNLIDSTNEKIINKFAITNPIVNKLLDYRERRKLVSTYGEKFISHVHTVTGRIHSNFSQLGAASGRMTSNSPKQNWAFSQ